tara:strand:+ start:2193 stop:2381 length:189 start_codon:yes stop_codon:yes gene_type:complete
MNKKIKEIEKKIDIIINSIQVEKLSPIEKHRINKEINNIIKKIKINKIYEEDLINKIKDKFK